MALLAPWFLVGLLGVGLPLWLHRFARDTRTKQPFASLMLLEPSEIHRSREHTLRYLLLLALRIGLLLLIVLAFTQPTFPWSTPPLEARDRTLHVIVLDTSLSMQQGDRWTRALERAKALVDAMKPADQGMLVTADSRIRVARGPVNQSDADELRSALAAVKPGVARLDYGMLMSNASSWLGTNRPKTQLHVITDLQQSATPLQFADLEPPQDVELVLEDIGAASAGNQYVKSVAASAQDSNTLEVRVVSTGAPIAQRTVVLSIDGKEAARKVIGGGATAANPSRAEGAGSAAARSKAVNGRPGAGTNTDRGSSETGAQVGVTLEGPITAVQFAGLDLGAGNHRASVTLEPADSLPLDDQFFAVLEHREPRALVVGANANADDVAYFGAAVGALTNPHLNVEQAGPDAIGQRTLADYSALVVSDAGVLSGPNASSLQRYLENGGAVLVTLGPRAAQLDRMPLSGHIRARGALTGSSGLGSSATRSSATGSSDTRSPESGSGASADSVQANRVAAVEQSHPALRDSQGWRSVRFFRYVPIDPLPGDAVLIRLEDGRPLLIERHVGAGRLLILTSPLDRDWNDLAIHPLFVRFIGEAARYLTSAAAAPGTTVGSVLPMGRNGRDGAQVFDPEGQRVLGLGDTAGQRRLLAERVGFYEVRGGGRSDWIAVNADPRESDLARMSPESIGQWRKLGTPEVTSSAADAPPASASRNADQGANAPAVAQTKSLWPWLLLIAVTLALLEPLMANSHLHIRRGVAS